MKMTVDPRLAYLRKCHDDPEHMRNQPARLAYLEFCLAHDSLSGDTRMMLCKQIEELRKQIEADGLGRRCVAEPGTTDCLVWDSKELASKSGWRTVGQEWWCTSCLERYGFVIDEEQPGDDAE